MDLLLITAASAKGVMLSGVDIQVKLNGVSAELDLGGVVLPEGQRPLKVEITLDPKVAHLFGAQGTFEYQGGGKLVPVDEGAKPPHFQPVRAASIEGGAAVMSLIGYVSRVRDVTRAAQDLLKDAPDRRTEFPPKDVERDWTLTAVNHVRTLSAPPLVEGQLVFDPADLTDPALPKPSIDPDADAFVLEVAAEPAPRLLAVTCPQPLVPDAMGFTGKIAPPVLLYFHPTAGQNFPEFYGGVYPFSWDFLYFGLSRYVFHSAEDEPLKQWGGKGMPYQMARAGRDAIFVLPLNKPFSEVGVMIDASATQDILEEVIGFLHRRKGIFAEPAIGRLALAGFSSGNLLVTRFLEKNAGTPLLSTTLKEVYNFDIPASKMAAWAKAAQAWLDSGDGSDKMLRAYTQQDHPEFAKLLGQATPRPPYVVEDATKNRSVFCVPSTTWHLIAGGQMASPFDFQAVHQLIAETCLTDAVRRSGFPVSKGGDTA